MHSDKSMKRNIIVLSNDSEETTHQTNSELGKVSSIASDEVLENNLVRLFSEFDQHLLSLNKKIGKDPYTAISVMLIMLNQCAEFTEKVMKVEPETEFLTNLANIASDKYSHLRLLHVRQNRISDATARNLYKGWTGEKAERNLVFKEISSGMAQILMSYLSFFTSSFNNSNISDQWDDICEVFADDLDQSLQSLTF